MTLVGTVRSSTVASLAVAQGQVLRAGNSNVIKGGCPTKARRNVETLNIHTCRIAKDSLVKDLQVTDLLWTMVAPKRARHPDRSSGHRRS